jgi:hypothetical protein
MGLPAIVVKRVDQACTFHVIGGILRKVHFVAATLSVLCCTLGIAAGPAPLSWPSFQASKAPGDAAIVKRIEKADWFQVCAAWGRAARSGKDERYRIASLLFITDKNLVNGIDLMNVKSKRPEIGMSLCGVVAQLGAPEGVNQTQRAGGHHSQLIYRSRRLYVYLDGPDANGLVTAVQF